MGFLAFVPGWGITSSVNLQLSPSASAYVGDFEVFILDRDIGMEKIADVLFPDVVLCIQSEVETLVMLHLIYNALLPSG